MSVTSAHCRHCRHAAAKSVKSPKSGLHGRECFRILAPSRLPPALAWFYAWRSLFPWHFCIFGRALPHFIRSQQHEHYFFSYPRMCCGCDLHGRACSRILAPSRLPPALARFYAWRSLFPWHFCIFGRAPPHFIRSQQHEHYYFSYPRMCCGCGLHGRECSRILAPSWFSPAPR